VHQGDSRGRSTPCPRAVLGAAFGHDAFRPGQREVIDAVLAGRDALAIMPTGAGKSVTYQVPALCGMAPVLVVSPLVALMRDQVAGAVRRRIRATWVDSTLERRERRERLAAAAEGSVDLLYVSPEGLDGVLDSTVARFGLLAVDEAHCISEWGHDFRPAYRAIGGVRARLGGVPVLAVTATATRRVADDIVASLGLREAFEWRGSFKRENLRLAVCEKDALTDARRRALAAVQAHEGSSGIVYCLSRRDAGALATYLRARGVSSAPYHAGMDPLERASIQAAFSSGEVAVVVATVAFGMGIDKADVRFVVHADLPGSIESYAQEVGRAGRDGAWSDCLLLFSWADVRRRAVLASTLPPERRRAVRARIGEVYRFASGSGCRHVRLCAHFDERVARCGNACDDCGGPSGASMCAPHSLAGRR
jgi:ATP-dependent DNA helicase RecQ